MAVYSVYVKTRVKPPRRGILDRILRRPGAAEWDSLDALSEAVAARPGVLEASVGGEADGLSAYISVDEASTAFARSAAADAVRGALSSLGFDAEAEPLLVYDEDGRLIEDLRLPR